jgi:hypothetical protein
MLQDLVLFELDSSQGRTQQGSSGKSPVRLLDTIPFSEGDILGLVIDMNSTCEN